MRARHRGRSRAAAPDSGPVPAARNRRAGIHSAPGGAVRRGHALSATTAERTAAGRRADRPHRRRRGPDPAGLAGRPHRQQPAGSHRAPGRAGHPADVHRAGPRTGRRPRRAAPIRTQALRRSPAHRARRRQPAPGRRRFVLRGEPVVADHRLQGHADRRPGHHHVPGPGGPRPRVGDRARPLALQHQHLPVVAAVPSLPLHRPQRRDQHATRQHQLDAGARGAVRVGPAGERPPEAVSDHRGAPERYRDLRQRARVPGHDRAAPAARGPDDDPGTLEKARVDGGRPPRFLRVPLGPDGAVGRPRLDRLHRRHRGRGGPRSQRAASVPLLRHQGRSGGHGVRGRRPERAAGERAGQGEAASGPDLPRGHRPGPHHRRRGDQVGARGRASLPDLAGRPGRPPRRPAARPRPGPGRPRAAAAAPAGVRVHGGGPAAAARPHGRAGRRAGRIDGHGYRAGGAVGPAAAALRLLQAALRAGHEPASRRHPGGARHGHELDPGGRAEPAEAGTGVLSPDPHRVSDPRQRGDRPDPAQSGPGAAGGDPLHALRPARRRGRNREGDGRAVPPGQRRRRRGLRAAGALGPRRGCRSRPDSQPPRHRRRAPPPRARRHPHPMRPDHRDGRSPRSAPHGAAARVRRRGDQPVSGVRDDRGADRAGRPRGPRRAEGHPPSRSRPHQGGAEGDVEDGHLDPAELSRRPDLRGGGVEQGVRRSLLHVDRVAARGNRRRHRRGGGEAAARAGVPDPRRRGRRAGQRRRVPMAARRGVPPVQSGHRLQAAARHPQRTVRRLPGLRPAGQRPEPETRDAPRPVRAPAGRHADPARRGGIGGVHLQAVRDRRDVVRLDQPRRPTKRWRSR